MDQKKFFDFIDRDLLKYKLIANNVHGRFYRTICSIYSSTTARVKVNNLVSSSIEIKNGVLQGESMSPTLASLYLNDFAIKLNNQSLGTNIAGQNVSILMYADDIVLIAETENNLQKELDILGKFCSEWCLTCNTTKTQIVHFRDRRTKVTDFCFKLNGISLLVTSSYKYLGVILDEHLTFNNCASAFATSGGRALSAVITKCRAIKNISFKPFYRMYDSCVKSVLTYCSNIWGIDEYEELETINKRFIRYHLGLPRYTPLCCLYLLSNMYPVTKDTWIDLFRFHNRLLKMHESRIVKKIYLSDQINNNIGWTKDIMKICTLIKFETFDKTRPVDLTHVENICNRYFENKFKQEIFTLIKPSVLKYLCIDDTHWVEQLLNIKPKANRSLIAKLISGVLKLEIETGRYFKISRENRLCKFCGLIEDEFHFLCTCPAYNIPRQYFQIKTGLKLCIDNVIRIFTNHLNPLSLYINDAWKIRSRNLFIKYV